MKSKPVLVNVTKRSENKNLKVLKFYADWCGPCKQLTAALEQRGISRYESVNVDEDIDMASDYGIRGIPALVKINALGDVVDTMSGFDGKSIDKLEEFFKDVR